MVVDVGVYVSRQRDGPKQAPVKAKEPSGDVGIIAFSSLNKFVQKAFLIFYMKRFNPRFKAPYH